jgi:hypothetical protein
MTYLVLTIDVEPDCSLSWHYSNPLAFRGVSIGIKERLQPLFVKYGVVPTYLINNVVLEDMGSVEVLKNLNGQFELGTHLHPEFIEPQKTVFNYAGAKGEANCCFYSKAIELEKIKNITRLFIEQFGFSPTSFRAGRFSAGQNTYEALRKLGYKVDTSSTPHVCWNDKTRERTVNYKDTPEQPFFVNDTLLEVPVSIMTRWNMRYLMKDFVTSMGGIRRKPDYWEKVWLRPVYSSFEDMKEIFLLFKKEYEIRQDVVLNMMFHNVEVLPMCSPYTKTENDCVKYLDMLERFFEFCRNSGVEFINLSALYELFKK